MQPNRCPQKDKEVCLLPPSLASISEMFRGYLGNKCTGKSVPLFFSWGRFNLHAAAVMGMFGGGSVRGPSSLNTPLWLSRFVPERRNNGETHTSGGRGWMQNESRSNDISEGKCHICHVDTCERLPRYTFILHPPPPAARRKTDRGVEGGGGGVERWGGGVAALRGEDGL